MDQVSACKLHVFNEKKDTYFFCTLLTLFRSRFQEGKVSLLETLTINVTFIYYTPISQKLTYNIVNHLSFPQSKNKKGTAVWLLPVSISVVRKAARFCCC